MMLEELQRRHYSEATTQRYIRFIERFAQHFHRSPDRLGPQHIREYQAQLFTVHKLTPGSVTNHVCALRFLYIQTLKRPWSIADTPYPKKRYRLPTILSQEEVAQLIDAAPTPFYRTILMTLYGTGVRRTELTRLKVSDIDNQRMVVHIQGGKCLGLQWADIDDENQQIHVRRKWTGGKVGKPKSKASKAPVPMVPLLAGFIRLWQEQTTYAQPTDWIFASTRRKGKKPRVANMLVEDYLRPAAVKVGVLKESEKVRFGFHNLRHSLASFLIRKGTDAKTVQAMLRHSDVSTTLGIYAHSMSEDRLAAQDEMLAAMMTKSNAVN